MPDGHDTASHLLGPPRNMPLVPDDGSVEERQPMADEGRPDRIVEKRSDRLVRALANRKMISVPDRKTA